jgi:tetratricopeptide (TPR) repeat protein
MPVENASPGPIKMEDMGGYYNKDSQDKRYNYTRWDEGIMTADVADARGIDGYPRRRPNHFITDEMRGIAGRSMWDRLGSESMGKHELEMLKGRTEGGALSRGDPIRGSPTTPGPDASQRCCDLARQLMESDIGPCAPPLSMKYAEILISTGRLSAANAILDGLPKDLYGADQCEMKRMRGVIQAGVDQYEEAHEFFDEAVSLTSDHATIVRIECDAAAAYIKEGRYDKLRGFLELSHNNNHLPDVDSIHFFTMLAEASYHLEEYKPALLYLEKALDSSSQLGREDSILNVNMAQIMNKLELHVQSKPLVEKSWPLLRQSFGLDHPYTFKCGVVLAETYFEMRMMEKGSKTCEEVLRMQKLSGSPKENFREINMRLLKAVAHGVAESGTNEKIW